MIVISDGIKFDSECLYRGSEWNSIWKVYSMEFNYYSCEMIFFFFSYSKDYASWFQNWKNDDFTRLRYYKKKVIENIPFVNVSNQFGNVMKLKLKVLLLLFSFFELLMKSWVHFVPSLITIYMQNYHTIIR